VYALELNSKLDLKCQIAYTRLKGSLYSFQSNVGCSATSVMHKTWCEWQLCTQSN